MSSNKRISTMVIVCGILLTAQTASFADFIIDGFSDPDPMVVTVISLLNPDPTLIESSAASILGGERDLLIDVMGVAGPVSNSGTVGAGTFTFYSASPGSAAILQYDGVDADIVGPPAALVNSEGLGGVDLTSYGSALYLDFVSIEGGPAQATGIEIAVSDGSQVAGFAGQIADSSTPVRFSASFGAFDNPSVFNNVSSIVIRINPNGISDVDFELDAVGVPEPATVGLLALGAVGLLARRRRS